MNHSAVERVLVDPATYRRLVKGAVSMRASEHAVLHQLTQAFEARLAALQQSAAIGRVDALFTARG